MRELIDARERLQGSNDVVGPTHPRGGCVCPSATPGLFPLRDFQIFCAHPDCLPVRDSAVYSGLYRPHISSTLAPNRAPLFKRNSPMSIVGKPTPGSKLLTPKDHALVMIDFQSQMAFATKSIDAVLLRTNAGLIARAAAGFKVPTVLTTVAEKSFSGPMFSEVTE